MNINIHLPITTFSEANRKDHWSEKAPRARLQRQAALLAVRPAILLCYTRKELTAAGHITIKLTRAAPRTMDGDNLQRALKAIRDGIADALEIDDGDRKLTWAYAQTKTKDKGVDVEITVEEGK